VLYALFGLSSLIGLAGLSKPVGALLSHGKRPEWSDLAGPICVLLVSLGGALSTVGARRAHLREDAAKSAAPLDAHNSKGR